MTDNSRIARLETQIGGLAVQFADFIRESKEHREKVEKDNSQIWSAIKEQGVILQTSVEKLTARGQISWPMIMATIGMVLSISGAAAGVGHALMESRIRQLEIQDVANRDVNAAQHVTFDTEIQELRNHVNGK